MSDLTGLTVVVTRPQNQAEGLIQALQNGGAKVIAFPTLAIEPLQPSPREKTRILDLDGYDFVICVSANAARIGLDLLADHWPQWPVQQQWIAVGPATGAAMADWQLDLKVADQGSTSETLLDWPGLQRLDDKRVLILRGQSGRETLAQTLQQRGAQVDYLELYRRVQPQLEPQPLYNALDQVESPILTVTSGDGLRNLMAMAPARLTQLQHCPLLVVSGRLAEFARQQGFTRVMQADSAADQDIVKALATITSAE